VILAVDRHITLQRRLRDDGLVHEGEEPDAVADRERRRQRAEGDNTAIRFVEVLCPFGIGDRGDRAVDSPADVEIDILLLEIQADVVKQVNVHSCESGQPAHA
jgi:hypothetical protein